MLRGVLLFLVILFNYYDLPLKSDTQKFVIFQEYEYDFGEIPCDTIVHHDFIFKNVNNSDLTIRSVSTSCRCTSTTWTTHSLSSMEEGVIHVTFSPKRRLGSFRESIFVVFSNGDLITLKILGHTRNNPIKHEQFIDYSPLFFEKDTLRLGEINQGKVGSRSITIYNPTSTSIYLDFINPNVDLKYSLSHNPIMPNDESLLTISYIPDKNEIGWKKHQIYPIIKGAKQKPLFILSKVTYNNSLVESSINPIISVKDKIQSFGAIHKGNSGICMFEISNKGNKPLEIYKIETEADCIHFSFPKIIQPEESTFIRINISSEYLSGKQRFPIEIYSNARNNPLQRIFIIGYVNPQ